MPSQMARHRTCANCNIVGRFALAVQCSRYRIAQPKLEPHGSDPRRNAGSLQPPSPKADPDPFPIRLTMPKRLQGRTSGSAENPSFWQGSRLRSVPNVAQDGVSRSPIYPRAAVAFTDCLASFRPSIARPSTGSLLLDGQFYSTQTNKSGVMLASFEYFQVFRFTDRSMGHGRLDQLEPGPAIGGVNLPGACHVDRSRGDR
jgi:hypothetical protein